MRTLRAWIHGSPVEVRVAIPDPAVLAGLEAELNPFSRPRPARLPGFSVAVRGLAPGESEASAFAHPGWLAARVTPELLVRWRPDIPVAEVIVHAPARSDEVVLATWGRIATGTRFLGASAGLGRTAFHAASVARDGQGTLLLGESGAGKTSLSVRSLGRGLAVLGDEDALVEEVARARPGAPGSGSSTGPASPPDPPVRLLALPRRLRVVHAPAGATGLAPTDAFGERGWILPPMAPGPESAPLGRVVLLDPTGPGQGPRLLPMARAEALFALLSCLERFPAEGLAPGPWRDLVIAENRRGLSIAAQVVAGTECLRLRYLPPGELDAAHALLFPG